ncbi:MAG: dihydroneopterin aldolase [Gammaproteobacteria bacterium]|nr:dihydroneopterin aldolase [Gammaproteobacteria bacterium]
MDITFIEDLKVDTVIGIYDWERQIRQTISIDLEMGCDISKAASEDTIDYCLDYKSVAKRIINFVEAAEYQTVETLAEKIASIVREEFNVPWLRLKVSKPGAVRGSKNVGVLIERGSKS